MKRLRKVLSLLLVGVIAVTSLFCGTVNVGADSPTKIQIYRERTGNSVKLYIDGINGVYFKDFNKRHSIKSDNVLNYSIYIDYNISDVIEFFVDSKDYNIITDGLGRFGTKIDDIEYYEIYDGTLTSGFCINIYDKSTKNKIINAKAISFIGITSWEGTDDDIKLGDSDQLGNYIDNDFSIRSVTVTKKSISDLNVASISSKPYTGKARKPAVTITDGNKTLKNGKDYTLSYSNNTKIGTATVTIKGNGSYTGSKNVTFKIVPPRTTLTVKKSNGKFDLSWKAISGIDKYRIEYSEDGGKTYKSAGTLAGTKTSGSLKLDTRKAYTFRVCSYKTINGTKYYSPWSKVVKA